MLEIDYSDEALSKLDHARLVLEGNERVWVRKMPDGIFIMDNVPLSNKYRLHDAVNSKGGIVHRRWTSLIRFYYKVAATEEEDEQARLALCDLVKALGYLTFMFQGFGALHSTASTKEDVERTRNGLIEALESLGMLLEREAVEPLEYILNPDLSCFVKATK